MHGEKYLKQNFEEEFHARAKLYAEIFGGTTDTDECGTKTESTGKHENKRGTMESDRTRAEYDLKKNQALSEQVAGLKVKVAELETALGKSVDRAMREQKKATEQEIDVMREAAK